MLDRVTYREIIIRPTLSSIGMWSREAENLIFITALNESNLTFLTQKTPGGALGFTQIEEATFFDLLKYLERRRHIKRKVFRACFLKETPKFEHLIWHLRLGVCLARIKYWMDPDALPNYNDAEGMWATYKKIYNTKKGGATKGRFLMLWEGYVRGYYEG